MMSTNMSVGSWVLNNTDVVPSDSLSFPFDDCGFLYGYGLFETIRVLDKVPLFLDDHLGRLHQSSIVMDLVFDIDLDQIKRNIQLLIEKNDIKDGVLNLYLTGGTRPGSLYELGLELPLFLGVVRERSSVELAPLELGVRQASFQRTPLDHLKTMAWVKNILEKRLAPEFNDVLLYDVNDVVLETTTANVFFVKGDHVITPALSDVLPGITRHFLVTRLDECGFFVEEREILLPELTEFDEIFLTNSIYGIISVGSVDGYGALCSGERFRSIKKYYDSSVLSLSRVGLFA